MSSAEDGWYTSHSVLGFTWTQQSRLASEGNIMDGAGPASASVQCIVLPSFCNSVFWLHSLATPACNQTHKAI